MILADFISFLKIGANIILAVLGFISFEDLYQQSPQNNNYELSVNTKTNFVEMITEQEIKIFNNIFYADKMYFVNNSSKTENLDQSSSK